MVGSEALNEARARSEGGATLKVRTPRRGRSQQPLLDFPLEWPEQSTGLHFHYVYTNHSDPGHRFVSVFVFVFVLHL